ncbi:MAG: hypothetical protein ACM3VT_07780 [Solirubrobacterales bacterium]
MKTTDKQIAANRRNAALSTGPITASGKAIAARNVLKHGLLAREVVIDAGEGAESREEFDAVLLDLTNQFDPQGPLEEMLVEKIAVAYWRLRRAHRYEVGLIRKKLDTATDEYYKPDPLKLGSAKERPDEIDAMTSEAQEARQAWQDEKEEFTKMRRDGKDLQEIYDREDNWEYLYDKIEEILGEVSDDFPANVREGLHKVGWTDDAIWQAHIDICTEEIESQARTIQALQKDREDNKLALQVRKKLGCMPDERELNRLLKYEGSIEKQFYRAIDQLERLQRFRAGDNVPAPVNIDVRVDEEKGE